MSCCNTCCSYCICCYTKTNKQKSSDRKSRKGTKDLKTESNNDLNTFNWKDDRIKNIKDSELTEETKIPSDKYNDNESFLKTRGYVFGAEIGKEGFGKVVRVMKLPKEKEQKREQLACKLISLSVGDLKLKSKKKFESVKNELHILVKAKHKEIVSIIDHFMINNNRIGDRSES
jgi:hypothetical protein